MLNRNSTKKIQTLDENSEVLVYTPNNPRPKAISVDNFKEETGISSLTSDIYNYLEVPVSSAEILDMGTTPIELLAAPGADNYYEVDKVRLEYTHVTTGYTYTDEIVLQINSNSKFIKQILGTTNTWLVISDLNGTEGVVSAPVGADIIPSYGEQLNKGLYLNTYNGTNPTLGDGTLRAIITYRVRTFGS